MSGPRWDPDGRLWLLDGEPTPRRNRRRSVGVIDRPDNSPESARLDLTEEGFASGAPVRSDRGRERWREPERPSPAPGDGARGSTGRRRRSTDPTSTGRAFPTPGPSAPARAERAPSERPVVTRDRWPDPVDEALPERPPSDVAGRHSADRPGADLSDLDGRPPRRHAPETSESDGISADGYAPARRPGGVGPPGYDRSHRGRHGAGGYTVHRYGSDRHAVQGYVPGRYSAGERDVDDRYVLEAGDHTSARYEDTVGYEPGDTVGYGYEPDRHGSRYRPDGYARARPGSDGVERIDRGYLDRGQPEYASDEFGSNEYYPDGRDLEEFASYEHEHEHDSDDDRTVRIPAGQGETGRRRAPDDGGRDSPAAEGPGGGSARRRARTGRSDERPTRRRRWPWVVGGVAAAAAVVPLGLAVLGGSEEQRGSSRAGSVVGVETLSGTGQPGVAPTAAGPAPPPAATQVTYEVTGSGSAGAITFGRGKSVAQVSDTKLPWKQTSPAVAEPAEYTLTAAGGSGQMSCRILVDGAVLAEEKADGDYAAVYCSGRR